MISGDVHVPQTIGPVTYVGAPYTVDFGDIYEPRVLEIGLTPSNKLQMQSIPCTGMQKRLIVGKSMQDVAGIALKNEYQPGDILKVRIDWTGMDMSDWPAMKKAVQAWAIEKKYVLHAVEPIVSSGQRRSIKHKPSARLDDDSLLSQYCKRHKLSPALQKTARLIMQK